ncbi:hypothetical protein PHYBOEH_005033 [Phytophthora boehmeriae]|uniref:Transmembrane protein n=1 Tax=Phytophthora boehmeriae TaxID=109152 RepID=A0A8T1WMW5_9STRA|nr:hypothetical protein PHYBOEH_005033 [Phytophthora boehmeriae]
MQQVAQEEMQTAKEEVDNALEKLVRNITIWRETYHKLKATNAQNRKTLQQLRDQKQQQKEDRKRQELRKLRQQEKIREQQEKITKVATSETVWKTVVTLYLSAEQFAWGMYRQLVLPVVAIMVFFGLMTVAIARLYAAEQARRAPRVLYSGYPKNYRQKQADAAPVADAAGLRSRAERRAVPRRERNDLVGN